MKCNISMKNPEKPIWKPNKSTMKSLNISQFQDFLNKKQDLAIGNYTQLHQFSVDETEKFWSSIVEFCDIDFIQAEKQVMKYGKHKIDSDWFVGGKLNYAQNILKHQSTRTAITFENEEGEKSTLSYQQMYAKVAKLQHYLQAQGIKKDDVVAGFLPNITETIIAMLATTSLGAIWTSTSPDFGFEGVVDRFGQVQTKLMFTTDAYYYNGKTHDCLEKARIIAKKIPSIEKVVVINFTNSDFELDGNFIHWHQAMANNNDKVHIEPMDFKQPLYILYSSGTTGKPKCIVHGHGGILLQHKKELVLHSNVNPEDTLFYFT
ncbi:MAG TPA: acetoacetate--CoA ligase, partial [Oceanospirillales bacterium]|nr:acetoacetate--CoA ligase [Oceanospirillales bacterium]